MNGCNLEWAPSIRDFQWGVGPSTGIPADIAAIEGSVRALENTGLDPNPPMATVRATYDARLINSYDFAFRGPSVGRYR
jgi:hypothetical protein